MQHRRRLPLALVLLAIALVGPWPPPPALHAQGVDVFLNVTAGGTRKLNIAIPEFTVVEGVDSPGHARLVATVIGHDLTFTGLFSVVAAAGAIPADDPRALQQSWSDFAGAGAHAGVHGLLAIRGGRLEAQMRLHDLTTPEYPVIATKAFTMPADRPRRLAHKIADDIVLQFTGEPGIADTKITYVVGPPGAKELVIADYDGAGARQITRNGSINLMPVWDPSARSIAFTSYKNGYPDLYRTFPFEQRPEQILAAFTGLNTTPSWSPDGRHLAVTLSKDGSPEIYVLTLATGTFRRLTRYAGIDTEPSWSPSGREIAFVSDRNGSPNIFVMDVEGANIRQVTSGGHHMQPRCSLLGNTIVYTARQRTFDLWAVSPNGSNLRRLTTGPGDNESAAWAPNGRHLAFQSNRLGPWHVFTMLADGSEQRPVTRGPGEFTSPSWSPRLP
jgi:TolB protein